MTTTVQAGAVRPQIDTEPSAFAQQYPARRPFSVQPDRSAENPFEAANGTLRFSNTRKAAEQETIAAQAARSGAGASHSAGASRTTAKSASGTKRASSSGGSKQPPKKRKRRMSKKKRRRILFAGLFLLFAVAVLVGTILLLNYFACGGRERCQGEPSEVTDTPKPGETPAVTLDETVIAPSVTINGVQVQNLTVAEARRKVGDAIAATRSAVALSVSYEEYGLTLHADDLGLDFSQSLEDALLLAAQSDAPQTLKLTPTFSSEALRSALQPLNDQIPSHAVNASVEVKLKTNKIDGVLFYQPYWDYTEGTNGARIDSEALERQIVEALERGEYTADLTPTVTVSEPEITVEKLQAQYHLLGSYTTNYRFKGSSSTSPDVAQNCQNRDINISKAIGMMQVVKLDPGKSFSFNKTTGERSEKKGWVPANAVYQGTGYTKEPGGGVCQVSTTIFNAILRAGITSINRRGHSIPSDYVTKHFEEGLGFDATVDYGHIDFSFKNDTGHTIYMFIYLTKNKDSARRKNINVEIYGVEQPGVEYRCRNEILEFTPSDDQSKFEYEIDKSMSASAKPVLLRNPHDGYKVKTYVDMYRNGMYIKTVRTEETVYKVIYPKYKIGSAEVTAPPIVTPKPSDSDDD